jgi:putative protease
VDLTLRGKPGAKLELEARSEFCPLPIKLCSEIPLTAARTAPLTIEKLREHLGRFGDQPFALRELEAQFEGDLILPIAELNRLRRLLIDELNTRETTPRQEAPHSWRSLLSDPAGDPGGESLHLSVLVRTVEQLDAALLESVDTVYCDSKTFGDTPRPSLEFAAAAYAARVLLATPRIQKAGEQGFFRLIENASPDGVLIRNLGAIDYFNAAPHLQCIGDFSLNVANPLTAQHFIAKA